MGMITKIDSLEEMCDMTCDNVVPGPTKKKQEWWIFTFGCGHEHGGHYVKIWGTFGEARKKMIDKYGLEWSFQHSEKQWKEFEEDPKRWWPMETELEVINEAD